MSAENSCELIRQVMDPGTSSEHPEQDEENPAEFSHGARPRRSREVSSEAWLARGLARNLSDFLSLVMVNTDLFQHEIMSHLPENDLMLEGLKDVKAAGNRISVFIRQLFAFSRAEAARPEVIDLNGAVEGVLANIERLAHDTIELETGFADTEIPVCADPGQLRQAIIGIASNAIKAMPEGGGLFIGTTPPKPVSAAGSGTSAADGDERATLTIRDSGCGMGPDVLERIFEPCFSTWASNGGTGLGLAIVQKIIMEIAGDIEVDSTMGKGTEFRIFLPVRKADSISEIETNSEKATRPPKKGGVILLCDDDDGIRLFFSRELIDAGYTVLQAENGRHALSLASENDWKIDLLVTDIVMPEIDGPSLDCELSGKIDNLKTLYVSGYSEKVLAHYSVDTGNCRLLQKPFELETLLSTVSTLLNEQ